MRPHPKPFADAIARFTRSNMGGAIILAAILAALLGPALVDDTRNGLPPIDGPSSWSWPHHWQTR